MTEAVVELATRHALVGTSHLFTGLVVTAMTGFGLDVGDALATGFGLARSEDADECDRPIAFKWWPLLFVPAGLAFAMQINAPRAQLPHIVFVACSTFAVSWGLSHAPALNPLNTFITAVATGLLANGWSNLTGRPAMAAAAVGVFVLVPDGIAELDSGRYIFGGGMLASVALTMQARGGGRRRRRRRLVQR